MSGAAVHPNAPDPELPLSGVDRAQRVRTMFARIVPHYDLMNRIMSGGRDGHWRQVAAAAARPRGAVALDVATGTGDLALELCRQGARRVIAVDYCAPMLEAAAAKIQRHRLTRVSLAAGDALALPFPDAAFDCVTSGFLLRNVVDLDQCLGEMRRVLRPGGRMVALEITHPPRGAVGRLARLYLRAVVPWLGSLWGDDRAAYRYLPASLDGFPDADRLADRIRAAGFSDVYYHRLGLGSVAVHVGVAPGARAGFGS